MLSCELLGTALVVIASPGEGQRAAGSGRGVFGPPTQADGAAVARVRAAENPRRLTGWAVETKTVHCGGMAPPPGEPTSASAPFRGRILVRRGDENSTRRPVAVLQPDEAGVFSAKLAPGMYCLVTDRKRRSPGAVGADTDAACLRAWWRRCDAVARVPSRVPVRLEVRQDCFGPCYRGPYPP